MSLQTPLNRVRGLGSAKEGTGHFWMQRLTAIANVPLVIFLIWTLLKTIGADYEAVRLTLASPIVSLGLLLLIVSGMFHMRLGMQVIIEDYIHGESLKLMCIALNTFFTIAVAVTCVYAAMKLSFGA